MKTEIWKSINNFDRYLISNKGRVKSLIGKPKILKPGLSNAGYLRVILINGKIRQNHSIHRLVAIHFIKNPLNKKCVNHKNGIKSICTDDNLEWCTYKENAIHAHSNGFVKIKQGINHHLSKPVLQIDINSNIVINEFDNCTIAGIITKVNKGNISSVCANNRKAAGGFKWKFKS